MNFRFHRLLKAYLLGKRLQPKFKLLCEMSIVDDEVIEKALHSDFKDFKDGIQYFSAIASQCDIILTRNGKDFKNALIPVMDAETNHWHLDQFKNKNFRRMASDDGGAVVNDFIRSLS